MPKNVKILKTIYIKFTYNLLIIKQIIDIVVVG